MCCYNPDCSDQSVGFPSKPVVGAWSHNLQPDWACSQFQTQGHAFKGELVDGKQALRKLLVWDDSQACLLMVMAADPFGGHAIGPTIPAATVETVMATEAGSSLLEAMATCFDAGCAQDGTLLRMIMRLDGADRSLLDGVKYYNHMVHELIPALTRFSTRLPSGKFRNFAYLNPEDTLPFLIAREW